MSSYEHQCYFFLTYSELLYDTLTRRRCSNPLDLYETVCISGDEKPKKQDKNKVSNIGSEFYGSRAPIDHSTHLMDARHLPTPLPSIREKSMTPRYTETNLLDCLYI